MALGILTKNGDAFNAYMLNPMGGISWQNVLLAFVFFIIALLIQALLVMIFWNLVLPKLFPSVPCLGYWEALALTLLVDVLFL